MTACKSSAARVDTRVRAADAVRLRAEGMTYREIAAQLGYPGENAANKTVLTLLTRTEAGVSDTLRELETVRLDQLWRRTICGLERSEKSQQGLSAALVTAAVRISERRSRRLGLDSPARLDVGVQRLDAPRDEFVQLRRLPYPNSEDTRP